MLFIKLKKIWKRIPRFLTNIVIIFQSETGKRLLLNLRITSQASVTLKMFTHLFTVMIIILFTQMKEHRALSLTKWLIPILTAMIFQNIFLPKLLYPCSWVRDVIGGNARSVISTLDSKSLIWRAYYVLLMRLNIFQKNITASCLILWMRQYRLSFIMSLQKK